MTATSVLSPANPVPTVRAWLRFAAAIVVIAAFTLGAFAVGRATSTTTTRPANPPAQVAPAVPTVGSPTAGFLRRNGRPF